MKLKADYDVAINCRWDGISIHFAAVPSIEVANVVLGLESNIGITMPPDYQRREWLDDRVLNTPNQRIYYWLSIDPVFEIFRVGRTIALKLQEEHGLTVCYSEEPGARKESQRPHPQGDAACL